MEAICAQLNALGSEPSALGTPSPAPKLEDWAIVAQEIAEEPSQVLNLVELLGPSLTHEQATQRRKGVEFLAQVLAHIPASRLTGDQIHFLLQFFLDRLKDSSIMYHGIVCGFYALHDHPDLTIDDLLSLLTALFDSIHAQSLLTEDREKIFEMLTWTIRERLESIMAQDYGHTFLLGFMQSVEGETHPRNLWLIFSHWPRIIQNLDISPVMEDVFDILACYFPIDFDQPRAGALGVTKNDLTLALERALGASPLMADLAFPLWLEKIGSDLKEAKLDAYRCLRYCVLNTYSPEQIQPHLQDVWSNAKQEIMGIRANADSEIVEEAYKALEAVTQGLTQATQSANNAGIVEEWYRLVWDQMKNFLKFTESGLFESSVRVLVRVCQTDRGVSNYLLGQSVPVLLEVFNQAEEDAQGRVLKMLERILDGYHARAQPPIWLADLEAICAQAVLSPLRSTREAGIEAGIKVDRLWHTGHLSGNLNTSFGRASQELDFLDEKHFELLTLYLAHSDSARRTVLPWVEQLFPLSSPARLTILTKLTMVGETFATPIVPALTSALSDPNLVEPVVEAWLTAYSHEPTRCPQLLSEAMIPALVQCPSQSPNTLNLLSKLSRDIKSTQGFVSGSVGRLLGAGGDETLKLSTLICSLSPTCLAEIEDLPRIFSEDFDDVEAVVKIRGSTLNKLDHLVGPASHYLARVEAQYPRHGGWILRGLGMKGSPQFGAMVDALLRAIELNPTEPWADECRNVVGEDQLLVKATHHVFVPFYRQKFFTRMFPVLIRLFREKGQETALEAVLVQLPFMPSVVVETEMTPLIPALTRVLFQSQEACGLSPAAVELINFLSRLQPASLEASSDVILPFLLSVANNPRTPLTDVIAALQAVEKTYSERCTRESQLMVVKGTADLRNHPKRLVRSAVVTARNRWMNEWRD